MSDHPDNLVANINKFYEKLFEQSYYNNFIPDNFVVNNASLTSICSLVICNLLWPLVIKHQLALNEGCELFDGTDFYKKL